MRRTHSAFLMIFVMLLFVLPIFAQEATPEATPEADLGQTETYTSKDGAVSFSYPIRWQVLEGRNGDGIVFYGYIETPHNYVMDPPGFGTRMSIMVWRNADPSFVDPPGSDYNNLALEAAELIHSPESRRVSDEFTFGDISTLTVGNKPAAWFRGNYRQVYDVLYLFIEEGPTTIIDLRITTGFGEIDEWEGILLAVAESIQVHHT